jgi:hypothetical protein
MDPKKLVSQFSEFSVIFYAIYKFQPKLKYYLRIPLRSGPWKLQFLRKHPCFCGKTLSIKKGFAMRPPAASRRGSGRNPATGGAGVWGKRWGKPRGSPRACFGGSEGCVGRLGGGARRRPALATAAAGISGEVAVDSGSARPGRLPRGPREVRGQLDSDRRKGRARSPSSPHGG